jgi:hypothetical protein
MVSPTMVSSSSTGTQGKITTAGTSTGRRHRRWRLSGGSHSTATGDR